MTYKIRYISIGAAIATLIVLSFAVFYTAKANPSFFIRQNNGITTTATTTINAFMTPGTATTTSVVVDAGAAGSQAADSAVLTLQLTGSSSPSNSKIATTTFSIAIEYAQGGNADCVATPNACNWFSDDTTAEATTTVTMNITSPRTHTITLGTQTLGGNLIASTTPTPVLFNVPMPTRYARAVISIVPGASATNGAVWAEFVAKRQGN